MLEIKDLNYEINKKLRLHNINIELKKGMFIGIIGENGCGKSTLLKNICGIIENKNPSIYLEKKDIKKYSKKELSKKISILSQVQKINFDFTVREIVEMGRYTHEKTIYNKEIFEENKDIIDKSLDEVGLKGFENRSFLELSGGESQRVLIARTLAQNTEIIILDEPTNHLDIKYQFQIMEIIKKQQKTVLAVIHDINIASYYCDYIYALKNGEIIEEGIVQEILTKEKLKRIYGIDVDIITHPTRNVPYVIYK
ncbi:ABC transporter ATP-binding protein [Cetobacterium sp. SF1]|uniref:ABC transporter ATP-binding protein n=1 Tax=Cetobacterium sp. SF1 TaxID=3417654 RepID=UPI003CF1195E